MKSSSSLHHSVEAFRLPTAVNLERFLDRLAVLYAEMDAAYAAASRHYGFICRGCDDNCCRSHFHHHTLLEYHYLVAGYRALDRQLRHHIYTRAKVQAAANLSHVPGPMCPLNVDGRCVMYRHRPMICRLHGLPHTLQAPGRGVRGPGCDLFEQQCGHKPFRPLDRTPLYQALARLEQSLRQEGKITHKIKLTVAEMILTLPPNGQPCDARAGRMHRNRSQ